MGVDMTGGLVMSMNTVKDLENPETGPFINKYLEANPEVSAENRMKMIRMMEYLTGIGNILVAESSQGGAPTASQQLVINVELRKKIEDYKKCVLDLAEVKK